MRDVRKFLAILSVLAVLVPIEVSAFRLRPAEKILFLGDSITAAGLYTEYVEAYLRTRFPNHTYYCINSGLGSENVTGLTESDHPGPRPNIHHRFTREAAEFDPTMVVIAYGMNEGIYHPLFEDYFVLFQLNYDRLVGRVKEETRARITLMTPPPFDPVVPRREDSRQWDSYGYKEPFAGYDHVLKVYSDWIRGSYSDEFMVADVHSVMECHLQMRRRSDPEFRLQKDGIHPDATGHLLMALTLLQTWQAPTEVDSAQIDAILLHASHNRITDLKHILNKSGISFTWTTRLPMPADPRWDPVSTAMLDIPQRFNRQILQIKNLNQSEYEIRINDTLIARTTNRQLRQGINLTAFDKFPPLETGRQILNLIRRQRNLGKWIWHQKQIPDSETWKELEEELQSACQPVTLNFEIRPPKKAEESASVEN